MTALFSVPRGVSPPGRHLVSGRRPPSTPAGRPEPSPAPPPTTLLRLGGELDLLAAAGLTRLLDRHRQRHRHRGGGLLIVDLSGVTFADCAGLRPLVDAARAERADRGGAGDRCRVALVGAGPVVSRLLALLEPGGDRWPPWRESSPAPLGASPPPALRSSLRSPSPPRPPPSPDRR